jgi:hypothetical protein
MSASRAHEHIHPGTAEANGCGHVFVINGNIEKISCDAWLLPTDVEFRVDGWEAHLGNDFGDNCADMGKSSQIRSSRSVERIKKCISKTSGGNIPWLVICSLNEEQQIIWKQREDPDAMVDWFLEGVQMFLEHAAQDLEQAAKDQELSAKDPQGASPGKRYSPAYDRYKPLLLVPVVGTGFGGAKDITGLVIKKLWPLLLACCKKLDIDVGVVTRQQYKVNPTHFRHAILHPTEHPIFKFIESTLS